MDSFKELGYTDSPLFISHSPMDAYHALHQSITRNSRYHGNQLWLLNDDERHLLSPLLQLFLLFYLQVSPAHFTTPSKCRSSEIYRFFHPEKYTIPEKSSLGLQRNPTYSMRNRPHEWIHLSLLFVEFEAPPLPPPNGLHTLRSMQMQEQVSCEFGALSLETNVR